MLFVVAVGFHGNFFFLQKNAQQQLWIIEPPVWVGVRLGEYRLDRPWGRRRRGHRARALGAA